MLERTGLHERRELRNLGIAHAHVFLLYLAWKTIVEMKASMFSQKTLAIPRQSEMTIDWSCASGSKLLVFHENLEHFAIGQFILKFTLPGV